MRTSFRAFLATVWARMTPADRRALRLGAWLVGPALCYAWIIKPIAADLVAARERLEQAVALQSREMAILATVPELPVLKTRSAAALSGESARLFPGVDPVAASAALVRYAAGKAAEHRLLIQTSETRPEESLDGGLVRLSVELRGVSDLAGVEAWLHALESGPKLVRVEELRIRAAERVNAGGADTDGEEVLGISIVVTGFSLTAAAPAEVALQTKRRGAP